MSVSLTGQCDSDFFLDEFGAAIGKSFQSKSNINAYHLRARKDFDRTIYSSDYWRLRGTWEGSLAYWKTDVPERRTFNPGAKTTWLASVSPVFRLSAIGFWPSIHPYIELGIGLAYFEHDELAAYDYSEGDLGGHFQFEDRISIGMHLPQYEHVSLAFSIMHYSNANIGDRNDGINLRMLSFRYLY